VKYKLTYQGPDGPVSSVYTRRDLLQWLEEWPDFTGPSMIKLELVED
jgi:hypothetical protein